MVKQVFNLSMTLVVVLIAGVSGGDCDWRYFQHYEQKGCSPVLGSDGCPKKFTCKSLTDEDWQICINNGKLYKNGESIQDLGPCDSCVCRLDQGLASIECAAVDCPDWKPKNPACYMGYKPGTCCPIEMCPEEDKELQKTCNYKGKVYKIGRIIETSNPCKSCICSKNWVDEIGPGCSPVNCLLGLYAEKIRRGCLPIYHEKRCCPTELHCDGIYGVTPAIVDQEDKSDYCYYQGKYYEKGSTAYLQGDKYSCITCKCTTPPDFTCVRKACPPKPREDCKTVYGHCCPKYECPQ